MRKAIIAIATAALALGGPAIQAKEKKSGEQQLAEMLEGYEAGEPVSCIPTNFSTDLTIIDGTALIYKSGRTLYVNRTARPQSIDRDDIFVFKRFSGSTLCKLDQVSTIDRSSGFYTGSVFLQDFVPYTKPKQAEG